MIAIDIILTIAIGLLFLTLTVSIVSGAKSSYDNNPGVFTVLVISAPVPLIFFLLFVKMLWQ